MHGLSTSRRAAGFWEQFKLFLALSRTPHGLIDMATPAFGALLWLGRFPSPKVVLLGLMTIFAGYTTIYALNDLLGWRVDREKLKTAPENTPDNNRQSRDLDAVMVRHPIAVALLSFRAALLWTLFWGAVAVVGAYLLNPFCVVVFLFGGLLESIYCLLLKKSYLRTVISGAVKTLGAVAAVFAVDPRPSIAYLALLFFTLFFWEIGGQNVPNDWADVEEDRRVKAQTIPIHFGPDRAITIILFCLLTAVVLSIGLLYFARFRFDSPFMWAAWGVCLYLLIWPAIRLHQTRHPRRAMALFNRASYFPIALFSLVMIRLLM